MSYIRIVVYKKTLQQQQKSQILVDQPVLVIKTQNTYFKQEICL